MSKKKRKGQIIKTLTLKWKVKCHYMKQSDGVFLASKEHNNSLFSFSTNMFLSFSISKMSTKESFVEKLQRQFREKLQKLKEEKQER